MGQSETNIDGVVTIVKLTGQETLVHRLGDDKIPCETHTY